MNSLSKLRQYQNKFDFFNFLYWIHIRKEPTPKLWYITCGEDLLWFSLQFTELKILQLYYFGLKRVEGTYDYLCRIYLLTYWFHNSDTFILSSDVLEGTVLFTALFTTFVQALHIYLWNVNLEIFIIYFIFSNILKTFNI